MSLERREIVPEMRVLTALLLLRLRAWVSGLAHDFAKRSKATKGILAVLLHLAFFGANSFFVMIRVQDRVEQLLGPAAVPSLATLNLAALMFACVLINLGAGVIGIKSPESENTWLLTLPISSSTLYYAKLGQLALGNLLVWSVVFPYLTVLSLRAGLGAWSLLVGVFGCMALSALAAALQLCWDALTHRWLPGPVRRAALFFGVFVAVALVTGVSALGVQPMIADETLHAVADFANALYLPLFASVVHVVRGGLSVDTAWSWFATVAYVGAALLLGNLVYDRAVRGCWWTSATTVPRRRAPSDLSAPIGLFGKELRWALREPAFFSTLGIPLGVAIGTHLLLWLVATQPLTAPARMATAFMIGALFADFMTKALIASDARAAWLRWTFPESYGPLIAKKVSVSVGVAVSFMFASLLAQKRSFESTVVLSLLYGTLGLAACATTVAASSLASGIPDGRSGWKQTLRVQGMAMLVTLLSLSAVVEPTRWAALSATVLSLAIALAAALDLRERVPFLLDPVASPPARIRAMDGVAALTVLLLLQDACLSFLARRVDVSTGARLVLVGVVCAAIVIAGALLAQARRGVPALRAALGLVLPRASKTLVAALASGLFAAVVAIAVLSLLRRFDLLGDSLRTSGIHLLVGEGPDAPLWRAIAMLLIAPLSEEFVFRGLIFGGLRRQLGPRAAILASSLLFAALHTPQAALPVFLMGACAALAYQRSDSLLAAIVVHVVYNAALLGFALAFP